MITVTATFTGGTPSGIAANLSEWRGIATSAALDASAGKTGSSNTPATGTATTSVAKDLVVGAAAQTGQLTISSGPTNSFSQLTEALTTGSNGNINVMSAYQIESATGSYSTSWTLSGSNKWAGSIASWHQ